MDEKALYQRALKLRAKIQGSTHASVQTKEIGGFFPDWYEFAIGSVYGKIYNRPGLDIKTRCLCTVAALTVLNKLPELKVHMRGALNSGASPDEIKEVLMQMGVFGGFPCALEAIRAAKEVFQKAKEEASDKKK